MFRTLEMEIDDLGYEIPFKKWDLSIPLETRMALLTKYGTYQHQIIQDDCPHRNWERGICKDCDFECYHTNIDKDYRLDCIDEDFCLDCGEVCARDNDWEEDEE